MNVQRWTMLSALALGAATPLFAQQPLVIGQPRVISQSNGPGMELFEWTGRVDREIQVVMRGANLWTNEIGQTEYPRARVRTYSRLPNQDGQVVVQVANGRGVVDVVQQPTRQNNYTTIVRLVDPRSGSADYRLVAYWQGFSSGDVYGGGSSNNNGNVYGNGRNRGNGRANGQNRDRDHDGDIDRDDRRGNDVYRNRRDDQEALHWSGNVDDELEIRIQNGRVTYRTLSGAQPTNVRANPGNANMVRQNGNVAVAQSQGRGSVSVVQQPSQWNGYTTVIRVRDPQGGYGYYDLSVIVQ
jgi:hypothetical protein